MIKLEFYVPENFVDAVKTAIFNAGAGKIGNYDKCSWETKGFGQYRPLEKSNPFLGEKNKVTVVDEIKVETVCKKEYLKPVIQALKTAHPYETPAYQYWEVNKEI